MTREKIQYNTQKYQYLIIIMKREKITESLFLCVWAGHFHRGASFLHRVQPHSGGRWSVPLAEVAGEPGESAAASARPHQVTPVLRLKSSWQLSGAAFGVICVGRPSPDGHVGMCSGTLSVDASFSDVISVWQAAWRGFEADREIDKLLFNREGHIRATFEAESCITR